MQLRVARALLFTGLAAASASAAEVPCQTRIPTLAAFPPVAAQSLVLTPATLKILAGGKGWGFDENLTIEPPDEAPGRIVMAVRLPKGSIDHLNAGAPMGGIGFRWRAGIPASASTACLTYRLKLPDDFQFNLGGKLPGLFGGDGPAGGKDVDGVSGFSARLMWRQRGQGEVYAYIPGKPDGRGLSIERGAWTFPRGRWVELQEEIVLNTPNAANGIVRVWLDGDLALERRDLLFRTVPDLGFAGVMADIFYGGKTSEWAAPQDAIIRLTPFELGWR
jgi:hypothetical protein